MATKEQIMSKEIIKALATACVQLRRVDVYYIDTAASIEDVAIDLGIEDPETLNVIVEKGIELEKKARDLRDAAKHLRIEAAFYVDGDKCENYRSVSDE